MSKITKIDVTEKVWEGKKTTSYEATLDDGKKGYFYPKTADEFKEGDEVTYTSVEKTGNKRKYLVFTLTKVSAQVSAPAQPQEKPPAQRLLPHAEVDIIKMKYKSRMQLVRLTHKLIKLGKLGEEEAKVHLGAWTSYVDGLIDGIFA